MSIAEHAVRNAAGDRLPGLAVILRFVNKWIAIVYLMEIDGKVSCAGVVARRFDVAHCSPRRQVGNVLRDVSPCLATIACQLHDSIIGACPDQTTLFWRLGDGKDHRRVLNADIVSR